MRKMISTVCRRIGIEAGDRLKSASKKIKFLVKGPMPLEAAFPPFQDFDVVHDYLITANPKVQSRLRKRGQNGNWSYQHTVRRADAGSQSVELRRQISHRDYVVRRKPHWRGTRHFELTFVSLFCRRCWPSEVTTTILCTRCVGVSSGSRRTFSWTSTKCLAIVAALVSFSLRPTRPPPQRS